MPSTSLILAERTERVLTLTLNRPDKLNALSVDMYRTLNGHLQSAANDPTIRAVLILGKGRAFTSGNDLMDFATPGTDLRPVLQFLREILHFPKALVVGVQGAAVGIGTTALLHADMVVAADNAKFKTPFVDLGLVPEGGASVLLPRLIGARRAADMILNGRTVTAAEALDWGLINEVCDAEDLKAHAMGVAQGLAAKAPGAFRASKALLNADSGSIQTIIDTEAAEFARRLKAPEAAEAFRAFAARRAPDYSSFE